METTKVITLRNIRLIRFRESVERITGERIQKAFQFSKHPIMSTPLVVTLKDIVVENKVLSRTVYLDLAAKEFVVTVNKERVPFGPCEQATLS